MSESIDLPTPDPAADFASVLALRRAAAQLERSAVDHALTSGWTWAQIGQALEMTAQAAHKRLSPGRRTYQGD